MDLKSKQKITVSPLEQETIRTNHVIVVPILIGMMIQDEEREASVRGKLFLDNLQTRDDPELIAHDDLEKVSIHPSYPK